MEHMEQARKVPDMRTQMPTVAAWMDSLRETFGKESINNSIRSGMNGSGVFYASENGHSIGKPFAEDHGTWVDVSELSIVTKKEREMLEAAQKRTMGGR